MYSGIAFTLNGHPVVSRAAPQARLLDVLREEFHLTGVKCGCGEGECGACAVLMDGLLVNACLVPAGRAEGASVTTIEGFSKTDRFRALSDAYDACGAVQCGFCTPGMILASEALLSKNPRPTDDEIRTALSGNFCRCTGYNMIVEAVRRAAKEGEGLW